MKKADIKVGSTYLARVSGRIVPVRVDAIRKSFYKPDYSRDVYDVTNLKTTRRLTFHSAAKFRSEVKPKLPATINFTPTPNEDERYETMQAMKSLQTHCESCGKQLQAGVCPYKEDHEPLADSLHPEGI